MINKNEIRFSWGNNWNHFLKKLSDEKINSAKESLQKMIGMDLKGKSFIDLGCGSGLFSLAAWRMKANIVSIDYDIGCVDCCNKLKEKYAPKATNWSIHHMSVLDKEFNDNIGMSDVVYSWGVLHHTGNMAKAIELAANKVNRNGIFFIAIYNDQGKTSQRWRRLKKIYNNSPSIFKYVIVFMVALIFETRASLGRARRGRNPLPDWLRKSHVRYRGMSAWNDWVDWVGGYPFEVASPEQIISMVERLGFKLKKSNSVGKGWGCNEYVFQKM